MTVKRFPTNSDFSFLSSLWELVKNSRNGLLCNDQVPALLEQNGFTQAGDNWEHSSFYGAWAVDFTPETETLWICQGGKEPWENPKIISIESPSQMIPHATQA
jgi:hypothetical protein